MSRRQSPFRYFTCFPSGIAFGILSVLVPLYFIEELGGSLIDLGIMTSVATIILIPSAREIRILRDVGLVRVLAHVAGKALLERQS